MPYDKKLKRVNKELTIEVSDSRIENFNLRNLLYSRTALLIKHDLLPKIATTECLCKGTNPPCARCSARDILTEAGFTLKEEEPKSNLILPNNSNIVTPG